MTPDDDQRVGFTHHPERVTAVVDALGDRVDEDERQYVRTRDLDVDGANAAIGAALALLADQPDAVEETYGIEIPVSLDRYAEQPAGIVWEVRQR